MVVSKQDLDKHTASVLGRIKDENERNSRGYHFAKLYYGIQEYDIAKRYLAGFLSLRANFAPAYKLMGQIHDGLGNPDMAVAAYKQSLDLDERQRDVVVSICEIYCSTGVDPDRAKYWAERAEKMCPGHAVIFKLRERMVGKADENSAEELEALITSELVKQPKNPELRAKLLRMYMETGRVNEAYTHAVEVENKGAYLDSLPWCNVLLEVLEGYQKQSGNTANGAFHQHLFTVHSRLVALSLESAKIAEIANALYRFDQSMATVSKVAVSGPIWETFCALTEAQYYSYAGHLLLKRAQQDHISWAEATNMAAMCYLVSYSVAAPNLQTPWVVKATPEERARYTDWHDSACFRRSEAGHLLTGMCGNGSSKWAAKVHAQWSTASGRAKIYDSLYTLRHMKGAKDCSFFMTTNSVTAFKPAVPSEQQLWELDKVAHLHRPSELRNLVWLALHNHQATDTSQPDYGFRVFDNLQFETGMALETASPESLSQLDTQAVLYATVHNAALRLAERQHRLRMEEGQPRLAPLCFGEDLCSLEQAEWWRTAYNLHTNKAREELGRLRLILQRGIETVRLIGNHGMPAGIVLQLARVFAARGQSAVSSASIVHEGYLQDRAALYWTTAVEMLERFAKNQTVWSPKKRLFPSEGLTLTEAQVAKGLEEGRLFLAVHAMHCGRQEEAIEMFNQLRSAEAAFYQAQIYRAMADDAEGPRDGEDSLQVALLTKARDTLYLTLDRISGQRHHKLTVVLPTEIDDVESKLNRLISGTANTNDSRRCSVEVGGLPEPSRSIMHGMESFSTSTPQRSSESRKEYSHTRPSPERMDAQMRALTMSQEVLIRQLIEQNEELKKQNALFSEEVTKNREEIEKLKSKVESSSATAMLITPMPALAPGSPAMHHPGLDRSGLRPPMPPMTPVGASPYGYPGYRPHEYDFSGGTPHPPPPLTAYSHHPQGYPLYGPPPPMPPHYPYPPQPGHQLPPTMPPSIGNSMTPKVPSVSAAVDATADDEEGYYVCDDDDYGAEEEDPTAAPQPSLGQDQLGMQAMPAATAAGFTIPDSQLIHDWPYGNTVNLEGKSTLTYSPNHPPMPPQPTYFPQMPPLATGPRPAMPPPTMVVSVPTAIGPGFFSSPERPNISAFGSRFQSPTHMPAMSAAGGTPSVMVGLPRQPSVATLSPPKPGFLPPVTVQPATSISSKIPAPNASLTPSAAAINPAQTAMPTATMVSEGVSLIASGIFTTPVTSEPAAATSTTGDSPFGTKYIMTMPAGTSTEAKPPASLSEPIAFNFGLNDGVNPSTIDNPEEEEDDTLAGDDGYQGPDFEPVIPLPDEVEVVTGEEDEIILFSARTKLFRFIENQWKERGLGQIRILHDAANGRVRTVMRREQVHKVCMNHCLNPKMTIDFKSATEKKVLSWQAIDFAEGESQMEKFCARFKTEDIAREFKDKFEEGVKLSGQKKATTAKTPVAPESKKPGLFEKFKSKAGTWDCDTCMINNSADQKRCVACTTPRPGITPEKDESTKVTMAAEGGFSFESARGVAVAPGGFKFGGSTVKICGNSGGFAFPSINTSSVPPVGTSDTTAIGSSEVGNSLFGNPATSGFQFGSTTTKTVADKLSTFAFPTSVGPAATGKPSIVDGSSGIASLASDAEKTPISVPMISPPKFKFISTTTTTPASTTTSTPSAAFNFQGVSLSTKSTFKFGESNQTEASTDTPAADMLKALANKSKPTDVPTPKATNQLGGFTFISTPVLSQEQPKEEKPKEEEAPKEEAKSSPFAGFSFVKPTSTSSNTSVFGDSSVVGSSNVLAKSLFGAPPSQKDTARVGDEVVSKQFGSESGATSQTFGGLIGGDTAKADAFSKKSHFKGFSGAGSQLFTTSTPKSGNGTAGDDEYEPDVDFQPIIALPDLVVTETGEESEEKLFSDRVKLFRNDQESKQWKERGIGEIKILRHKETNRCRLLMRREQVLKICCNQIISSDIKLQKLATSDKAWCWLAQDFSEGEVKIEQFAVRFKSIDLAVKFKEVYDVAAQMSITDVKPKEAKDKTGKKNQVPVKEKLLKDMFKPTEGEWQCESCYVKSCNPTVCPACLTAKPGVAPPKPDPQPEVLSTVPGFRFGSGIVSKTDKKKNASLKDMFKTPEGEWQCDTCYVKSRHPAACPACMTPKPGAEPPKPQPEVSSTSTVGGFKFGSGRGFKFGSNTTTEEKPKSTQFLKELLNTSDDSADSNVVSSTTTAGSEFGTFKFSGAPTSSFSFIKSSDDKEVEATKSSAPFTFTPSSSTISGLFGKPTDANSSEVTKSSVFKFTPSKSIVSSTTGTGFVFGKDSTDSGSSFCFTGITPSKPLDLSATRTPKSPGDDSDFYVNQDGDDSHIYFEPIVQLEKVEVKTGEEDEEVIYCHRAKLFLFSDREWKERGRGDVKILKHKETKKHRIIMRREQVHKLCLNHYVTPDLEMVPLANANGKAWVWQADDFIDNEIKHEQLAIRFRDEETAAAFHGAFLKSQEAMKSLLTPTKKDASLSAGSVAVSSHSVKESSEKLGKEKQQLVQSSQVTSSKTKDSANFVFGGTPAPSSFSFTTSSTPDSKPAVFGGTPTFSGASAFNVSSAKFSFGSTTMALTEAHFGGMKESANVAGSGASPLDKAKSLPELMLNQQSDPVAADADDIVIISEKSATPEQVARARVLQLPDHFYLYEDKEPCSGCLGCDDGEGKMVRREEPKAGSVTEETVTMIHANITGKDGNPYYTKQLNQADTADLLLSDLEVTVVPKTACLTGDKGNTHYAKQLELAAKNIEADATHYSVPAIDSVIPKTACATDDKGNPHYAEELQMAAQNIDAKPGDAEPSSLFERGEQGADFTFDGVATGTSGIPAFGFGKNKEGDGQKPFSWQGAGSSLFTASGPRHQEDEDGVVTSDDVHFEPIISLPEVEVKTGEEDEDALYCQRAKLFRFDNKLNQWKERGVGDMKLLRHRETGRIRVLMRREKVLKLACNHALTTAMSLKPLHTSEVAWCWFALDIAEGEPRQEHIAIKFKTAEIAGIFKQKFEECQALLASSTPGGDNCSKSEILSPDTSTYTDGASVGGHDTSQSQADDTEDYDDYGDEEDEQPWFTKRCTMMYAEGDSWKTVGMGELDVTYDDDVNGARVTMATDNNTVICNHIICREYSVQCNETKLFCEWTAKDFSTDDPVKRTFRVQFSSKPSIREFQKIFEQGLELANDSQLSETLDQGVVSQELYK